MASSDYSLSDIQRALNEKKAKQAHQQKMIAEHYAREMPVKHVSEEDKKFQIVEQRLTAISNRLENLMGLSGRVSLIESQANTLVSGIGHNALGGSQGSGIVRVADADDMFIPDIAHGESIVYDATLQGFRPGAGGGGGGGAGTLDEVLYLGNTANEDILFQNDHGIVYNEKGTDSTNGYTEWRTGRNAQGGRYKRETFNNGLDSAKIVHVDTKYDKDKDKGLYIEPSIEGGDVGGVTLSGFDARTVNPFVDENKERLVNVETLENRIQAQGPIDYGLFQNRNVATQVNGNGQMWCHGKTNFSQIVELGFTARDINNDIHVPPIDVRHPIDSYILLIDQQHHGHYGLYQVTTEPEPAKVGARDAFNFKVSVLEAHGNTGHSKMIRVFGFDSHTDMTLLDIILEMIDEKVDTEGDTMTGPLIINNDDKVNDPVSFEIRGIQSQSNGSNYVFSSHLDSLDRDVVAYHGPIEDDFEITTKKYVDNLIQAIAGGLTYVGDLDPNTQDTSDLEDPSLPGHFYIFSADGDWEGTAVKSGDWLIYDGQSWNHLDRDLSSDYLPLDGGTMTGDIRMGPGAQIKMDQQTEIITRVIDSEQDSNLILKRKGEQKLLIGSNGIQITGNAKFAGSSGKIEIYDGMRVITGSNEVLKIGGQGLQYTGVFTHDDHIATKKDLEALNLSGSYVPLDGSTAMTGNLKITRTEAGNTESKIVLTGARSGATNAVATIVFANDSLDDTDANKGYLTYRAGNSDKYFRLSKRIEIKEGLDVDGLTRIKGTFNVKKNGAQIDGENIFNVQNNLLNIYGKTIFNINSNEAIEIKQNNTSKLKIWASGAVSTTRAKTAFGKDEFVSKEYIDDNTYRAKAVASLPAVPTPGMLYRVGDQLIMGT